MKNLLCFLFIIAISSSGALAQMGPPTTPSFGGAMPASEKVVPGIGWYEVLEDGIAESERTRKPIFFLTAAPQCGGIPGMW